MLPNSEDPDAASDQGLHCLPISQKWDARLIWVKLTSQFFSSHQLEIMATPIASYKAEHVNELCHKNWYFRNDH